MTKRIALFCGSKKGIDPNYAEAATEMASILVKEQIGMVFGGGKVGLMGVSADEVIKQGGEVIGIIPKKLMDMEVGHEGVTKLHVVNTMHERKAMMAELSDGFIAMPGGIGTFEEIFEVFTWHQIGYHNKPCAFLNTHGYYDHLISFLDHTVNEGFLSKEQRSELIVEDTPRKMMDRVKGLL